jgi:hypothetical protein
MPEAKTSKMPIEL